MIIPVKERGYADAFACVYNSALAHFEAQPCKKLEYDGETLGENFIQKAQSLKGGAEYVGRSNVFFIGYGKGGTG